MTWISYLSASQKARGNEVIIQEAPHIALVLLQYFIFMLSRDRKITQQKETGE